MQILVRILFHLKPLQAVDATVNIDKQLNNLKNSGYSYVSTDALQNSNYSETSGTPTLKLTNSSQTAIYKFKDVQGPQISVDSQTREVGKTINPITITTTDNSKDVLTTTVTGLPSGLSLIKRQIQLLARQVK